MKKSDLAWALLRAVVAAVFIYSGWSKLLEPYENFVGVIAGYRLFDLATAERVALVFPWVELIAGLFFLLGLWIRAAHAVLWAANTAFLGIVASALVRGIQVEDCGCFGGGAHLTLQQVLIMDAVLWCLFYVLARCFSRTASLSADRLFEVK